MSYEWPITWFIKRNVLQIANNRRRKTSYHNLSISKIIPHLRKIHEIKLNSNKILFPLEIFSPSSYFKQFSSQHHIIHGIGLLQNQKTSYCIQMRNGNFPSYWNFYVVYKKSSPSSCVDCRQIFHRNRSRIPFDVNQQHLLLHRLVSENISLW